MKNIKITFSCFGFFLFLFCSQSLFAQTTLYVHNDKIGRNLKDSIEKECYIIKNKDLMIILDSVITEWKKSPYYWPEYNIRIYTYLVTKNDENVVQENEIENKKDVCWRIEFILHQRKNIVEKRLDWGYLKYKNIYFALAGHPCKELFNSQGQKAQFPYTLHFETDAFSFIMSWSYKYYDNHFILTDKKDSKQY